MKSLFGILLGLCLLACNAATEPEETTSDSPFTPEELSTQQQAWDEVMEIHDEVMPKMGAIHQATKKLKEQWENNAELDSGLKDEISIAIEKLETADEAMWEWMHQLRQLDKLRAAESHDAIMTYLAQQKTSMTKVRQQMLNSLESADSLITRIGQ